MTGCVVWISGLPQSGKSTLARAAAAALREQGKATCVLDGDELRGLLDPAPGYTEAERDRFYGFLARLAAHLAAQDLAVLVPATAYRRRWRDAARALAPRFCEVHVAASADECRARDEKGLYQRAERGEIAGLPGFGVEFEPPESAEVVARSGQDTAALDRILALVTDPPQ